MARPLPKDIEQQIAGTAKKRELISVGFMGFIIGTAFGAGLMMALSAMGSGLNSLWLFAGLGCCIAVYVMLARRAGSE